MRPPILCILLNLIFQDCPDSYYKWSFDPGNSRNQTVFHNTTSLGGLIENENFELTSNLLEPLCKLLVGNYEDLMGANHVFIFQGKS